MERKQAYYDTETWLDITTKYRNSRSKHIFIYQTSGYTKHKDLVRNAQKRKYTKFLTALTCDVTGFLGRAGNEDPNAIEQKFEVFLD